MLIAAYVRPSRLNVREEPGGEVVGTMEAGHALPVESVEGGWCRVPGGWVRRDLVTLAELDGMDEGASKTPAPDVEKSEEPDEDAGELVGMKLNDLRALAKASGVSLPRNATKAQIIGLLLHE